MDVIVFIAVGLVSGVITRRIVPWRQASSLENSMVVGIVGALAGGYVGRIIGYREGNPMVFVLSIVGAIALVAFYLAMTRRRTAA